MGTPEPRRDEHPATTLVCLLLGVALTGLGVAGALALLWGARAGQVALCLLVVVYGVLFIGAAFAGDE